jgi:acyl carrier protein
MPTPDDVKAFLKTTYKDKLARAKNPDPPDDFSLLEAGIVDSFGLLDLVALAEKKFGVKVDLGAHDIDVFATVGGFATVFANAK